MNHHQNTKMHYQEDSSDFYFEDLNALNMKKQETEHNKSNLLMRVAVDDQSRHSMHGLIHQKYESVIWWWNDWMIIWIATLSCLMIVVHFNLPSCPLRFIREKNKHKAHPDYHSKRTARHHANENENENFIFPRNHYTMKEGGRPYVMQKKHEINNFKRKKIKN